MPTPNQTCTAPQWVHRSLGIAVGSRTVSPTCCPGLRTKPTRARGPQAEIAHLMRLEWIFHVGGIWSAVATTAPGSSSTPAWPATRTGGCACIRGTRPTLRSAGTSPPDRRPRSTPQDREDEVPIQAQETSPKVEVTTTMTACAALLGSLIVAASARADADSYIATLDVMGVPYRNRAARNPIRRSRLSRTRRGHAIRHARHHDHKRRLLLHLPGQGTDWCRRRRPSAHESKPAYRLNSSVSQGFRTDVTAISSHLRMHAAKAGAGERQGRQRRWSWSPGVQRSMLPLRGCRFRTCAAPTFSSCSRGAESR